MATAILAVIALATTSAPDGASWRLVPGQGYEITLRATNPATVAGTEFVLQATATYYDETGRQVGEAASEPLTITVGQTVWKREWVYTLPRAFSVVMDSGAGEGGLELRGERVAAWVNCPNDGQQHEFRFRMILTR